MPVNHLRTIDSKTPLDASWSAVRQGIMDSLLHLTRLDPAENMARFYRLELQPDLFGGTVLIRSWGRIGTRGQDRRAWFRDEQDAELAQISWAERKGRRGYHLVCAEP